MAADPDRVEAAWRMLAESRTASTIPTNRLSLTQVSRLCRFR
jgi:hypothetical protein